MVLHSQQNYLLHMHHPVLQFIYKQEEEMVGKWAKKETQLRQEEGQNRREGMIEGQQGKEKNEGKKERKGKESVGRQKRNEKKKRGRMSGIRKL